MYSLINWISLISFSRLSSCFISISPLTVTTGSPSTLMTESRSQFSIISMRSPYLNHLFPLSERRSRQPSASSRSASFLLQPRSISGVWSFIPYSTIAAPAMTQ